MVGCAYSAYRLALTSLQSHRPLCLTGSISVCPNLSSLSSTPSLFFSFIPRFVTLPGIPLPTSNKLSSLGDFNSYNLESFHFSLFPRQILLFQLNVIFHLEYLKPPKCFLLPFNLSILSTATRGSFLQCKSDHVGSRKLMASIAL